MFEYQEKTKIYSDSRLIAQKEKIMEQLERIESITIGKIKVLDKLHTDKIETIEAGLI